MIRTVTTFLVATLTASQLSAAVTNRAQYLMGTVCEIAIQDTPEAARQVEAAFSEASRVERAISTWKSDSELSRINRGEIENASPEVVAMLADALRWSRATNGAFNPLVGPMVQLWRTREDGTVPDRASIDRARDAAALSNITIDGQSVTLHNAAAIEEGGFGKGYALDRMIALLPRPAMVDFGGQVIVAGMLRVQVADPAKRDRAVLELTLTDESISTSSGSEKTFDVAGVRFSHILDPRTGRALPPRGSVSVVASRAMDADILSTALYVMGPDEGLRWADEHSVDAIFISPDHVIRTTRSFRDRGLKAVDPEFHIKQ
jgi:thiamine biosynthesis lipoprotein